MRYALDADVLIGALDASDPNYQQARNLFVAWRAQGESALVSVVNLSEVLVAPAGDPRRLRTAREAIAALGVSIHSPTEAIGVAAAQLRARHPISLPDAYLLATAMKTGSAVVSFDRKVARAATVDGIPVAASLTA